MRSIIFTLLLCFCAVTWAVAVERGDDAPVDQFIEALKGFHSLEGNFTQKLYDEDNSLLMESSGNFRLLRPGFFSWEIMAPDNQLVIANPEFVWHYDRDLDTVTRRPANAGGMLAPLQILGGDETALRQHYRIDGGAGEYTLTPLQENAGFQSLRIVLTQHGPARMEISDNLQQRILIAFQLQQEASNLEPADFSFSPPPESDVFYYDE